MNIFYYLYYVEFIIALGGSKWVDLITNKDIRNILVLIHQAFMCEFQRKFKFGMEDKKWHYKYRRLCSLYRVALIQSRGSSLVVTCCTSDVRLTSDRPVTLGLVPVELSTSIYSTHSATYVVNACIS